MPLKLLSAGALGAIAEAEAKGTPCTRAPVRHQERGSPSAAAIDSFVHDKNIAYYRSLLESEKLSDAERHTVQRLLSEEEQRLPGKSQLNPAQYPSAEGTASSAVASRMKRLLGHESRAG